VRANSLRPNAPQLEALLSWPLIVAPVESTSPN
jgi:hypothetical protein